MINTKSRLGASLIMAFLSLSGAYECAAQNVSFISCVPKAELSSAKPLVATQTPTASYKLPVPLSHLGTIAQSDNAVCNLLFRHKDINDGAWLLASSDKPVTYFNQTASTAATYQWTVPGTTPSTLSSVDADVTYSAPGTYAMPTLKATDNGGTSSYQAPYTVKVGGTSEITTMDCREWGSTYMLSAAQYGNGQGYVGGTNAVNIVGYGNLFMLGTDDAYLDGVNVYLLKKPTMYKEGAALRLQVWMTNITTTGIQLAYLPVEGAFLKMSDIKADGEDGAWAPIYGGAVAEFKFDTPLSMYGKTTFFVSIEGFSNDPLTEDFVMLEDMIGKQLDEVDASNMLCHNSFARQMGETDYLRPVSMYGGGTGSFAICPIVRIPGDPSGISSASTGATKRLSAHFTNDNTIAVAAPADGDVSVCNASGAVLARGKVEGGQALVSVPSATHGLYVVNGPDGHTAKILR